MTERPNNRRPEIHQPHHDFEERLRAWLEHIQPALFTALEEEYNVERGWLVCGPAAIALSRLMQEQSGVPIGRHRTDEHIELAVGFFDPADRGYQASDHTHLRYYDGRGGVYYTDMIYNRLWPGAGENQNQTIVEGFGVQEIDARLQQRFSLYPLEHFGNVWPRLAPFDPWGVGDFSPQALDDFVGAMNRPEVTDSHIVTESGVVRDISFFWGERVQRVIDRTRGLLT